MATRGINETYGDLEQTLEAAIQEIDEKKKLETEKKKQKERKKQLEKKRRTIFGNLTRKIQQSPTAIPWVM